MQRWDQPVTESDCQSLQINSYAEFVDLVMPDSRDFTEIAMNRQNDRDIAEGQNSYILQSIESGVTISLQDPIPNDVQRMLALTLSMLVLNRNKNREIRRCFDMESKGQQATPIRMLFGMRSHMDVDSMMKFVGLKRSAHKYRLKLIRRYGNAQEGGLLH